VTKYKKVYHIGTYIRIGEIKNYLYVHFVAIILFC
jgi:hypothetical protein